MNAFIVLSIAEASEGCRKLILDAHGVAMLCVVMKRHSLAPPLQRDGIATLACLMLHGEAGRKAVANEKEGVEVFVGGMLLCAREKLDIAHAADALRLLAEDHPDLVKRIGMANGKKYLQPPAAEPDAAGRDVELEGEGVATEGAAAA